MAEKYTRYFGNQVKFFDSKKDIEVSIQKEDQAGHQVIFLIFGLIFGGLVTYWYTRELGSSCAGGGFRLSIIILGAISCSVIFYKLPEFIRFSIITNKDRL